MLGIKKLARGDTIVEVLLAMVVISLVLGASYGIANRSLAIGRAAHEQTEALKIAETQIELLKVETLKSGSSVLTRNDPFCIVVVSLPVPGIEPRGNTDVSCNVR